MNLQKAPLGARIGACLLDGLFVWIILMISLLVSFGLYLILLVCGSVLYFGICEGSGMSASLGKRICGLMVVDDQGQPLTTGRAFARALCRVLSGAILGIGFLIGLFDPEGKTLHDKLAGTFVTVRQPVMGGSQGNMGGGNAVYGRQPQLIGVAGQFAGRSFPVSTQGVLLGRDQASCDFAFPPGTQGISRNHCKVQFNPQTQMFVLYDLGSTYGTFLGSGVQVPQGQPMALRSGDEFYLASRANLFRVSL